MELRKTINPLLVILLVGMVFGIGGIFFKDQEIKQNLINIEDLQKAGINSQEIHRNGRSEFRSISLVDPIVTEVSTPLFEFGRLTSSTINEDEGLRIDWHEKDSNPNQLEYEIIIQNTEADRSLPLSIFIDNANFNYNDIKKVELTKIEGNRKDKLDEIETIVSENQFKQKYNLSLHASNYYTLTVKLNKLFPSGRIGFINEETGFIYHPWFNVTFLKRIPIIMNSTYTQTNYTLLLFNGTFNTNTLIGTSTLQADCDDILVTDPTGTNQFSYMFEKKNDTLFGCNSANTLIWTRINVTTGNTTIGHLYYNNPTALNQESHYGVFNDYAMYYLFNGNNSIEDVSGHSKNATVNSTMKFNYTTDFFGRSFALNNTGNYWAVHLPTQLTGNFSIGWFEKYSDTGQAQVRYNRWEDTAANREVYISINTTDHLLLQLTNAGCLGASTLFETNYQLTNNGYYHIVFTYDSFFLRLYVNGALVFTSANQAGTYTCGTVATAGAFGVRSWDNVSAGNSKAIVDNFFIIARQMSSSEVSNQYKLFSISQSSQGSLENFGNLTTSLMLTPVSPISTNDLNGTVIVQDNNTLKKYNVTFQWLVNGIPTYTFTYLNSVFVNATQSTILTSGNLSRGDNWTVTAQVFSGAELGTAASISRTIGNAAPTTPTNLNPSNNSLAIGAVNLSCSGSTDSDGDIISYEIYGSTTNPPITILQNNSLSSYIWSGLTSSTYFWRCRARDDYGSTSDYTEVRKINTATLTSCSAANSTHALAYNFTFGREVDLINAPVGVNATMGSTFTLYQDTIAANSTISFTTAVNVTNAYVCIFPSNASFQVNSFQDYVFDPAFDRRQYFLLNNTASNTTQSFILYLLQVVYGSSTTIKVLDEFYSPVEDAYVYVERFYPSDNSFRTVAMVRTDNSGEGQTFLQHNVPYYRFKVWRDGRIVLVSQSQKVITEVGADTVVTLVIGTDTISEELQQYGSIEYSLTFNNLTRNWCLTYIDTQSVANPSCLSVQNLRNGTQVYNQCLTSQTGSMCYSMGGNVPMHSKATYYTTSPRYTVIASEEIQEQGSLGRQLGNTGIILMIVLLLSFAALSLMNLYIGVVGIILALLLGLWLNITGLSTMAIISVVIILLLVLFRGRQT